MDLWVQRLMGAVILVAVVALAISYVRGNDGQVFAFLTGLITGLFGVLGVGNIWVKPAQAPCPPENTGK